MATNPGHLYATYELGGPEALSQRDMAAVISRVLGREIRAAAVSLEELEKKRPRSRRQRRSSDTKC